MPLPIVGGFFAWLVGLFSTSMGALLTWLMARMVYERALHIVLVTGFLVTASSLLVSLAIGVKAAVFGLQIGLPPAFAAGLYFLPSNTNVIFAAIVTIRVSVSLYRWTVATLSYYLPSAPGYKGLVV